MNCYGTPRPLIPLDEAAAGASTTADALAATLGTKCIVIGPNKRGVTAADLEAVSEGASEGLTVREAPLYSPEGHDSRKW